MKYIMLIVTLLCITTAHAVTSNDVVGVGFDRLSEADKLDVLQTIAAKKAASPMAGNTNIESVSEWVQLGSDIGKGLAGAAKELGVAANEFVNTPVGKLATFLIVWHFIGSAIIHILGGLLILMVGSVGIWWYIKLARNCVTVYDPEKRDWFGRSVLVSVKHSTLDACDQSVIIWCGFFVALAWAVITFTF